MADSKISALSAITALTGDELLVLVDDDDGTPVTVKITIEDFLTAAAARTELTGTYGALDEDDFASDSATLPPSQQSTAAYIAATSLGLIDYRDNRAAVQFQGTSGNVVGCPDSAGVSVVGDLEIEVWAALADWSPTGGNVLIGKTNASSSQRSWHLQVDAAGTLTLSVSTNGSAATAATSSTTPVVANGEWLGIKVTRDKAAGEVKFYTASLDDPTTWTQLGTTVTGHTTSDYFDSTARLTIGALDNGASTGNLLMAIGKFGEAYVRSGIGGAVVAHYDPRNGPYPAWKDSALNLWTYAGSAWGWSTFG